MSVLLLLAAACTTTGDDAAPLATYTLTLAPLVPLDDNPLDGVDRIDLVLDSGVGEPVRVTLEAPASGDSALAEGLPALESGLIRVEGYAEGELVAWGQTGSMTLIDDEITATVFVSRPSGLAQLGNLPEEAHQGGGIALGGGRFVLMGGAGNRAGGGSALARGLDTVLLLDLGAPSAELAFTEIDTLPSYVDTNGDDETERRGFTVTQLTAGDAGKYLIAGGGNSDGYSDASLLTADARLFDPESLAFEGSLPDKDTLYTARTRHAAMANQQGGVLLWGGFGGASSSYFVTLGDGELYDPVDRSFAPVAGLQEAGVTSSGSVGVALADLGDDGILVAGGTRPVQSGADPEWRATDVSLRVSLRGDVEEIGGMEPMAGHAMVTLADGDVLSFGGVSDSASRSYLDTGPAVKTVWRFQPGSQQWDEVGQMKLARAGHRAVVLDGTRVLIVGGAAQWGPTEYPDGALSCVEIYDAANETSSMVGSCSEDDDAGGLPARQQEPIVLYDPELGVLAIGGRDGPNGAVPQVGFFATAHE